MMQNIEALEKRLWAAADQLRANSGLGSNEYFMPVLGILFLRHAYNRFSSVAKQVEESLATRSGVKRQVTKDDFTKRRSIFLRKESQYEYLVNLPGDENIGKKINEALGLIEKDYDSLKGILPRNYEALSNDLLRSLIRTFNDEVLRKASGDVFGRIYEYFLMKFSMQGAHDSGEFFTPPSIVETIVNVIEPDHGIVFDPACGSGGMFVQTSHFLEQRKLAVEKRVTFFGQEKNETTIRIAKMNLAVHGLEGNIIKGNTFYEDNHEKLGKADFVMANPPFNVDGVDAKKIDKDPRLPFGLPGVNSKKHVSNGNYLWISYFYSYLNAKGRSGFVMSSQASSAGHGEKEVRKKIVQSGHVDAVISIRSNFFYTRSVPCELWFFDRAKPSSLPLLPKGEGDQGHYRGGYDFAGLVKRARELRKQQTPAEQILWELLRDRRLAGLKFRRQHQIGDYIVDFYCHEQRLVVELFGDVHQTPPQAKKDTTRRRYLEGIGCTVLVFQNEDVFSNTGHVLEKIARTLPSPNGRGMKGEGSSEPFNTQDNVLMIDARNIYRKVTRKINDFSPEQLKNIAAITWLYRGQTDKYLNLIKSYFSDIITLCGSMPEALKAFDDGLQLSTSGFAKLKGAANLSEPLKELDDAARLYEEDKKKLLKQVAEFQQSMAKGMPEANAKQVEAREKLDPIAEKTKGLMKQIELLAKLVNRAMDKVKALTNGKDGLPEVSERKDLLKLGKQFAMPKEDSDETTLLSDALHPLKEAVYFQKQIHWLQMKFPDAKLADVEGLVKLVDRKTIEKNDWSVTPGRYVGIAPPEEDDDFDFEDILREIHVELGSLNDEANELAKKIKENFDELGI